MTLQELNELIDKAINNAAIRPTALDKTNALNAIYSNGAIYAYLDLIWKVYGIDAFVEAIERTAAARQELLDRSETIYA